LLCAVRINAIPTDDGNEVGDTSQAGVKLQRWSLASKRSTIAVAIGTLCRGQFRIATVQRFFSAELHTSRSAVWMSGFGFSAKMLTSVTAFGSTAGSATFFLQRR
jgi:hypothetical protein